MNKYKNAYEDLIYIFKIHSIDFDEIYIKRVNKNLAILGELLEELKDEEN